MTQALSELTCTPCRGGIPPLGIDEARRYLAETPAWNLQEDGGQIQRTFWFANFRESLDFARAVGELAESERHHPDLAFGWGYATISLRTKKIKGLHENDFIMAAKIDRLAQEYGAQETRPQRERSSAAPAARETQTSNDDRGSTHADHRH
jgi:4a-hydroxytetrahydrobiopterin dehydratase